MKRLISVFVLLIATHFCLANSTSPDEAEAVRKVVQESYVDVLYGESGLENLRKGFHPEFNMYVYYKGVFSKRTLDSWLERLETNRRKNAEKPKRNYRTEFAMIDVTGQTAMVKLIIYEDEKLKFTDYLTLYKVAEGWRVITKQFSMH